MSNAVASTSDGTETVEAVDDAPESTQETPVADASPTPPSMPEEHVLPASDASQYPTSLDTIVSEAADVEALIISDQDTAPSLDDNSGCSDDGVVNDNLLPIPSPEVIRVDDTAKDQGRVSSDVQESQESPNSDRKDTLQLRYVEDNVASDVPVSQPPTPQAAPPSTPPLQHRRRRVPRSKELSAKPMSRLLPGAVRDTRTHDPHTHPAIPILPNPTPSITNQRTTTEDPDKLDAGKVYSAASFGLLSPSTVNWMSDTFSQLVTEAKNYSTMAVDSMTTSSTRRKRKRVNVQDGASEVSSATEDNGIGSLYVHIDSAIMVRWYMRLS